jgi:hypothetical protein
MNCLLAIVSGPKSRVPFGKVGLSIVNRGKLGRSVKR